MIDDAKSERLKRDEKDEKKYGKGEDDQRIPKNAERKTPGEKMWNVPSVENSAIPTTPCSSLTRPPTTSLSHPRSSLSRLDALSTVILTRELAWLIEMGRGQRCCSDDDFEWWRMVALERRREGGRRKGRWRCGWEGQCEHEWKRIEATLEQRVLAFVWLEFMPELACAVWTTSLRSYSVLAVR